MRDRKTEAPTTAVIGFAADDAGGGVAFVSRVGDDEPATTLRVPFTHRPAAGLAGRDVAYAAVAAAAAVLLDRGVRRVSLVLDDGRVAADLAERGSLPQALQLPYVTLRCRLNRFASVAFAAPNQGSVEAHRIRDLTARARAEVSLHVAA